MKSVGSSSVKSPKECMPGIIYHHGLSGYEMEILAASSLSTSMVCLRPTLIGPLLTNHLDSVILFSAPLGHKGSHKRSQVVVHDQEEEAQVSDGHKFNGTYLGTEQ